MIRITALNEDSSGDSSDSQELELVTKEAQEEEALELYNKGLELLKCEDFDGAEKQLKELLETDLLARSTPSDDLEDIHQPSLRMKYSSFKNLAAICLHRKEDHAAMKYLLEAVNIDNSDVSLWYKIGGVAMKIHNYPLARLAFEEGLKCNKNHWPCLDSLITVLYVLNDYSACLNHIAKGLKREEGFLKGLAFRDAIFKEQPCLEQDIHDFYTNCACLNIKTDYDKELGLQFTNEALDMREKRRELAKPKPKPILTFQHPLKVYTWKNLGERICELYDFVKSSQSPITLSCVVNLSKSINVASNQIPLPALIPPDSDTSPSSSMSQTPFSQSLLMTMTPSSLTATPSTQTPGSPTRSTPSSSLPFSTPSNTQGTGEMEVDTENVQTAETAEEINNLKRVSKRKRQNDLANELAAKRRSTRVRNPGKKSSQENVNYYELLQEYLPPEICGKEEEYDNSTPPIVECDNHITNDHHYGHSGFQVDCSPRSVDCSSLQSTEEVDVKEFLSKYQSGHTFVHVIYCYLTDVGSRFHLVWPPGLVDVFMATYARARIHFEHPSVMFQDEADEYIRNEAMVTLAYNELKMDKWQSTKPRASASPVLSPRSHISSVLGPGFPGEYFLNDIEFLMHVSIRDDILQEKWASFALRALWLRSRYFILLGSIERALHDFDQMLDIMNTLDDKEEFVISNSTVDNIISKANIQKQINSVKQCQSLEEVQRLYDRESYQDVVKLLLPTFTEKQHLKHKISSDIPERHAQLLLLQNSLMKLKDFDKCIEWGEKSINEALQQYTIVSGITARTDWGNTMTQLLEGLESCLKNDAGTVTSMSLKQMKRLYRNIIKVISLQMNGPEISSDIGINTLIPWIILFRLVRSHEKKTVTETSELKVQNDVKCTEDKEVPKPSSLMILFMAHDCLGRRSWCCSLNGRFLLQMAELLLDEVRDYSAWDKPHRVEIENNLEQCFFCLYGHPNKKTKSKHIQEHGSPQLQLTWERAQTLFEYFKPYQVPEFDSYKTNTISSEVENLLRRVVVLIPQNKEQLTPDSVTAYIEGSTDKAPTRNENQQKQPIVDEIYYLLADYYFKNKEQGKAIKFYILDISLNPDRMDSWAGMALARSSQIEQKLNSNELKPDGPLYRKASAAMRCFQRAVEIDYTNLALWIEYGSLAYQMHAHSSRQLKQKEQFDLSPEIIEMLKNKKKEFLSVAFKCFLSASQFEDENGVEERWLHHYMLGKIAEKNTLNEPQTYLRHYKKAALHLHKEGARYPRKINYHNPPYLSLEALEVYYRVHASALKYLMKNENSDVLPDSLEYVSTFLKDVANGPFANFQEEAVIDRSGEEDNKDGFLSEAKNNAPKNVDKTNKENFLIAIDVLDHLITEVSKDQATKGNVSKSSSECSMAKVNIESKRDVMKRCVDGIKQCAVRFTQHYKSLYRLAHYYFNMKPMPRTQISYDYLIGGAVNSKTSSHVVSPGLFNERKNTNFFNGIWRIPVDEIDRPGSFAWHMYRSVSLLKDVVKHLKDALFFSHLTCQLHRTPDPGKKYLRDLDRTYLANQVYLECVDNLRVRMDSLMQEEPPPTEERILQCLLDIYKTWQTLHKNVPDPDHINELIEEAYTMYKLGEVDSSPPVLDQAIAFCQALLQAQAEKARILQQQKLILQQQRVIEQTLLSAGIQPCISTNLEATANLNTASLLPGTSAILPGPICNYAVRRLSQFSNSKNVFHSEFLNVAIQQPTTSTVHSAQESSHYGALLSLPDQPRPSQDDISVSLSQSTLQTFDSVLSRYEHYVQQDHPVLKAQSEIETTKSGKSTCVDVVDYVPADAWPKTVTEPNSISIVGQLDRMKTSQAFQEQQTLHQRNFGSLPASSTQNKLTISETISVTKS